MPVFFDSELVAWTAALSHTTETGAVEPGGMPLAARARFEEGMNLPPMRVGTNFRINADVLEMFAAFGIRAEANVTGTSPETPSSYNAHPQAVIGHMANYIYEYVFHDLPVSSATFEPIDFVFPPNSMLSPEARAATSCSVMAATGAMSAVANCVSRARFGSDEWRQVAASQGNGGNAIVLAGLSQWGAMFADMIAYPINTEGQGARATEDGMDAYGFPWCAFGRAPDVESMENEFPR